LLLGYCTPAGKLIYAGRAGTGILDAELERLWQRLHPLAVTRMPLSVPPPMEPEIRSRCMTEQLPVVIPKPMTTSSSRFTPAVPALVATAGERAGTRFLEFAVIICASEGRGST
jgi:hypothetical protein